MISIYVLIISKATKEHKNGEYLGW